MQRRPINLQRQLQLRTFSAPLSYFYVGADTISETMLKQKDYCPDCRYDMRHPLRFKVVHICCSVYRLHVIHLCFAFDGLIKPFLQRVSVACYAERCISHSKSVRLSVTRWH